MILRRSGASGRRPNAPPQAILLFFRHKDGVIVQVDMHNVPDLRTLSRRCRKRMISWRSSKASPDAGPVKYSGHPDYKPFSRNNGSSGDFKPH